MKCTPTGEGKRATRCATKNSTRKKSEAPRASKTDYGLEFPSAAWQLKLERIHHTKEKGLHLLGACGVCCCCLDGIRTFTQTPDRECVWWCVLWVLMVVELWLASQGKTQHDHNTTQGASSSCRGSAHRPVSPKTEEKRFL